jgi:hypothetical protein
MFDALVDDDGAPLAVGRLHHLVPRTWGGTPTSSMGSRWSSPPTVARRGA